MKAISDRFWNKVAIGKIEECWRYLEYIDKGGYGRFWYKSSSIRAHRVAWELANGPISNGLDILHKCNNRSCCNPKHLYCGTHSDNMKDKSISGNVSSLSLGLGKSKLHNYEILDIRIMKGVKSQREIAKEFNVSQHTIGCILRNSGWLCKEGYYV